ncbi:hypothetical protein [Anaerosalibacter sp. Marseille-P3206]|uniref:hypothetical protein n=1 Tax=Anaerosalibacter sp. Marseille-P3206 TaxID=1871005 RepID=UPI000986FA0C|nr:hypothetical protein [Anaerosalibacter sp. Marseille-P3206]
MDSKKIFRANGNAELKTEKRVKVQVLDLDFGSFFNTEIMQVQGLGVEKQEIFKNISYEVEFPFEKFFISEILAWNMENIQASDILIKIEGNKVKMFTVENCFGKYKTNQFPKTYLPKAQSFEIN